MINNINTSRILINICSKETEVKCVTTNTKNKKNNWKPLFVNLNHAKMSWCFVFFTGRGESYLQPHDQRQVLVSGRLVVSIIQPPEHVGPVPHLHIVPGFFTFQGTEEPWGGGGFRLDTLRRFCLSYSSKHPNVQWLFLNLYFLLLLLEIRWG